MNRVYVSEASSFFIFIDAFIEKQTYWKFILEIYSIIRSQNNKINQLHI